MREPGCVRKEERECERDREIKYLCVREREREISRKREKPKKWLEAIIVELLVIRKGFKGLNMKL